MNLLTAQNISKSYGTKVLLNNVDLLVNRGDKIALLAKNGTGKSTLLKIIASIESSDSQHSLFYHDSRVGYLPQEPEISENSTLYEFLLDSTYAPIQALKQYEDALTSGDEKMLEETSHRMDELHAWSIKSELEQNAAKLGFADLNLSSNMLSGGQRKRIALAKIISESYDLLLLDEPTNHLDMQTIEWLEEYLSSSAISLLMVTHDRYFMDQVCDTIYELEDGSLFKYPGDYTSYLERKTAKVENTNTRADKFKKLMKKELTWIKSSPRARTTKNKARIDNFDNIKSIAGQAKKEEEIEFMIAPERLGSKVVEFHNVGFTYGEDYLFKNFQYKFKKKERVGIVGHNGVGKTTFLKVMLGELSPSQGKVVHGDTLKVGYFDQKGLTIDQDKPIIDILRDIAEYIPLEKGRKLSAEQLLERFLFPRDQHRVMYSKLSGGEKRRLYLLTILMKNPNFLVLDEPTNDLDIMTLATLESFLDSYPGCLVLVSHDRYLTDRLTDHLFIIDGSGEVIDYNGSYSNFIESSKSEAESDQTSKSSTSNHYEERKALKRLEKEIKKLEEKKTTLQSRFLEEGISVEDIVSTQAELDEVTKSLEEAEEKWFELSEELS